MEFSVAEMFHSEDWIQNAAKKGLRLFAVQKNTSSSNALLSDIQDSMYAGNPFLPGICSRTLIACFVRLTTHP